MERVLFFLLPSHLLSQGAAAAAARCTHTERSPQVPVARVARGAGAEWSSGSVRRTRKQSPGPSSHREPSSPRASSRFRSRHRQLQPQPPQQHQQQQRQPRPGIAETRRAPSRRPQRAPREPARAAGVCARLLP
uniref:uncharacterized protein LOC117713603 n=1 Tax=Arvicanthis niloticus TaxID=61156 RepID=UPI001485E859|nr:uncharacterized protein LOC117713603 [Arvicanthis niloticus]